MTSLNRKSLLALLALALCYTSRDLSSVMMHMRGKSADYRALLMAVWFCGIFASALLVPSLARLASQTNPAAKSRLVSRMAAALLLAALGTVLYLAPQTNPAPGWPTFIYYVLEPFCLSFFMPMAFYCFFTGSRSRHNGLFFGVAMAIGHLCWILLTPNLALPQAGTGIAAEALAALQQNIFSTTLPFLFRLRAFFLIVAASIFWWLMIQTPGTAGVPAAMPASVPRAVYRKGLVPVLVMLVVFFFLNGMAGSLFFPRIDLRFAQPGLLHFCLIVLLPLTGHLFDIRGNRFIRHYMPAATACFLIPLALLFYLPDILPRELAYAIGSIALESMLLVVILLTARYAFFTRVPGVVLALGSLASSGAIAGGLAGLRLLPLSSHGSHWVMPASLALCGSILYRILTAFSRNPAEEAAPFMPALGESPLPPYDAEAALKRFSHAYGFSDRETEVLRAITAGELTPDIAATLALSENTIRVYISRMLKKTDTKNRQQLTAFYSQWEREQTPPDS